MRREPIGARGIDERRRRRSGQLGLRLLGDVRQDESQCERVVPGLADAREEQIGIVAACAEQQRHQSKGEMLRDVTERNVRTQTELKEEHRRVASCTKTKTRRNWKKKLIQPAVFQSENVASAMVVSTRPTS